jgi:hypothetical protein
MASLNAFLVNLGVEWFLEKKTLKPSFVQGIKVVGDDTPLIYAKPLHGLIEQNIGVLANVC